MKYIIMLVIVLGLAVADFLTGIIKAFIKHDLSSAKMRKGGLNKIGELIIMATACGLEIGIRSLGQYYQSAQLAEVAGTVAAGAIFTYIVLMELISIFENYGEISPDAAWVNKLMKKLRNYNKEDDDHEKGN